MLHREKNIELLNNAVALEIETVLQYLYFHFHFKDKGYSYLAKLFKMISIKETEKPKWIRQSGYTVTFHKHTL